jgi:hypothetical protein
MKNQWIFAAGMGLVAAGLFLVNTALTREFMMQKFISEADF